MQQTIEIKTVNALTAWKGADATGKKLLENLLGKEHVSGNIRDMVNSFDDILAISGKTMADLANANDEPDEIAYKQAKLIAKVYNQGAVLNVKNTNEYKYFPWHKIVQDLEKPSGFGLSFNGCVRWYSNSDVGVRLCFTNYGLAKYFGMQFIDLHTDHHLYT